MQFAFLALSLAFHGSPLPSIRRTHSPQMKAFPYEEMYEEMVIAKLYKLTDRKDAVAYLDRHSTRFMLKEAGLSDSEVAEAKAIVLGGAAAKKLEAAEKRAAAAAAAAKKKE